MGIIGENIKKLRNASNLTINELSNISGIDENIINDIEFGVMKNPNEDILNKISKSLGVTLDGLTEMDYEYEYEYVLSDIEEAFNLILKQDTLTLDGKPLCDEAKNKIEELVNSAIQLAKYIQKDN